MNVLNNYLDHGSNMDHVYDNTKHRCRICLSEAVEQDMESILEPLQDGHSIADILENISIIKVERDTEVSKLVCKHCSKIIFDFHYLVKTYYDSEQYFKMYLAKTEESESVKEISSEIISQDYEKPNSNSYTSLFNEFVVKKIEKDVHQEYFKNRYECYKDSDKNNLILFSLCRSDIYSKKHKSELSQYQYIQNVFVGNGNDNSTSENSFEQNENSDLTSHLHYDVIDDCGQEESNANERQSQVNSLVNSSTEISETKDEELETEEIPSIKYSCEICGDCFLFKSGFGHHMLMVHNICIQVNQYEQHSSKITIKVPKGFSDTEPKQVRRCNPPIPLYKTEIQCKKCKETFGNEDELKKHIEVHKTFRCDQCGAAFIKNSYLRDHLLKHSADKCFSCKDCGQAFKYRSALAVHRREHVGDHTGHMCETCGKNFKERGTLKTHIMLKHTNERNFPCSGCDLSFKLKAARDKHYMRKHTSNRTKDFVCSTCGMAYLNKETLTRHTADKHTGTPSVHWCNVCHKSFTMKSNLSKHLKNKHNVVMVRKD